MTDPLDHSARRVEKSKRSITDLVREVLRTRRSLAWMSGLFAFTLFVFLVLIPFGSLDTIIGDNIAQVGYWRVLFHRQFVGSIGTSSMKPALILLLGSAYDVSSALFGSTVLVKLVFALSAVALVTIVAVIAADAAGIFAGIGAAIYLTTQTPIPALYTTGSSMIVFLPALLWGVWLFTRGRDTFGAVVVCLAATVRIEAFAVLLWLSIAQQLSRRRWRALLLTATITVATVLLTALVYFAVQGSLARFNAGGPDTGYIFSKAGEGFTARLLGFLKYAASSTYANAVENCGIPYLAAAALVGFVTDPARRCYVAMLGIPAFLMLYITTGMGQGAARYFEFLPPLVAAFGASGVAYAYRVGGRQVRSRWLASASAVALLSGVGCYAAGAPRPLCALALLFATAGLGYWMKYVSPRAPRVVSALSWALLGAYAVFGALRGGTWREPRGLAVYTLDAIRLLADRPVPKGMRVLLDDDVIYGVLLRDPSFLRSATALQFFNVQDDERRAAILQATDYVLVSKARYSWHYLRYDPLRRRRSDPFRAAVLSANPDAPPRTLYGRRLVTIERSKNWIVLKVEPA